MQDEYYYSPKCRGFYLASLKEEYERSDWGWPDDAVVVEGELYNKLIAAQGNGKVIIPDERGMPVLDEAPIPTKEQLISEAESKKAALMLQANNIIAPLQDAIELDMSLPEENISLTAWKKYRILLSRVDTTAAPDIDWPSQPEF